MVMNEKEVKKRIDAETRRVRKLECDLKNIKADLRGTRKALRFWTREMAKLKGLQKTKAKNKI